MPRFTLPKPRTFALNSHPAKPPLPLGTTPADQITSPMLIRWHKIIRLLRKLRADPNPLKKYPSVPAIARILENSKNTIRRDIAILRDQYRLPLDEIEEYGGWGFTEDVTDLPNILMTQGDLVILCAAWGALEGRRNSNFGPRVRPVMEKLLSALGQDISFDYTAVSERIVYRSGGYHSTVDIEIFETVVEALLSQHELEFVYRKPSTDGTLPEPETRRGRPRCLACIDQAWYLFVDDLDRDGKPRKFALYRMQSAVDTRRHFEPETPFDIEEALSDSVGVDTSGDKAVVELRFKPEIAGYASETHWHKTERFTALPDGSLHLQMEVFLNAELESKIHRWGPRVEVLNPPDLRQKFATYAREAWEMYRAQPNPAPVARVCGTQ